MDVHWLDDREARAWRGFHRMHERLFAHLDRSLARHSGLSGADYAVLVSLSEVDGGRLRAFELGAALQWEKSRLSHQITRMQRRGLVCREECPSDARGLFVVITDAGRRAIADAAPRHVDDVRTAFVDVLTTDELDALARISEAVLERLDRLDVEAGTPGDAATDRDGRLTARRSPRP